MEQSKSNKKDRKFKNPIERTYLTYIDASIEDKKHNKITLSFRDEAAIYKYIENNLNVKKVIGISKVRPLNTDINPTQLEVKSLYQYVSDLVKKEVIG